MPLVGFLPATDERFQQTVQRCLERLAAGPFPLLYRYLNDDASVVLKALFCSLPSGW